MTSLDLQNPNVQILLNYLRLKVPPELLFDAFSPFNKPPPSRFLSEHFRVIDPTTLKPTPIQLLPHQAGFLDYAFNPAHNFQVIVYSAPKKSGKTAIAGGIAQYVVANSGPYAEVFCMASDQEQAKGRIFKATMQSIQLDPKFDRTTKLVPGQWQIRESDSTIIHLPTNSTIKATAVDYKGEAGSNPTMSLWSELWSYTTESQKRLYRELTPVPTRPFSYRYVETYAGYRGESDLLEELYDSGVYHGRRLTKAECPWWLYDDEPPIYVNEKMRLVMYWDDGPQARRMPWQTIEYYEAQAAQLAPDDFDRFHNNYWKSAIRTFIPIEWWRACINTSVVSAITPRHPKVIGVDASVSKDTTAVVMVSRHPTLDRNVVLNEYKFFEPGRGRKVNYGHLKDELVRLVKAHNIVEITYDPYQLHNFMTDFQRDEGVHCRAFPQGQQRNVSDKNLHDLIQHRSLHHNGSPDFERHVLNAGAKTVEESKLRIVKQHKDRPIDGVVALSMAVSECLRLWL